jgi:hypothetical protein
MVRRAFEAGMGGVGLIQNENYVPMNVIVIAIVALFRSVWYISFIVFVITMPLILLIHCLSVRIGSCSSAIGLIS